MYRLLFCTLLSLAIALPARAASSYAGEFLAVGAGARALALGNAYVAIADDATAGYWNPAALAAIDARQAHAMHGERFSGLVDQDFLALAQPGRRLDGIALSLLRVGVGDIKLTTLQNPNLPISPENRPIVASVASSADYALYLSGARRLHDRLALGTSLKLIYRSFSDFNAYGFGLDLGLRLRMGPGLVLAANLRDLTTTPIYWSTDASDRISPSLLLGLAYSRPIGGGQATAAFASRAGGDAENAAGDQPLNAALEYWYGGLALRAGLEENRQAFGIGVQPHQRLTLDVAYLQHNELEATYLFSAGFRF